MQILIDQKTLTDALTTLAPAIAKRSTLPILSNVKIAATADGATLTATDLEAYATVTVPALVDGEGATTVSYKDLLALVKPLKKQVLCLSYSDGKLLLETDTMQSSLDTIPASEYPCEPTPKDEARWPHTQTLTLPIATLRHMVGLVGYAASEDSYSRPVLSAIHASLKAGTLTLDAGDSYRLARMSEGITGAGSWPFDLLWPAARLAAILKKFPKTGDVTLRAESSVFATLEAEGLTVHLRLVEGNYPNVDRVIPRESDALAEVESAALHQALKSVETIAKDSSNITRLHLNGAIEVRAKRDGMTEPMRVHVDAQTTLLASEAFEVLYNWEYLDDVLLAHPSGIVQFGLTDALKPVKITYPDTPGFVGVLMPMHPNR